MNEGYQIIQIDSGSWRIEDGMVRCYLLEGAERALLVDTGMTLKNAREIAEGLTDKPLSLLNTHGDPDHIAGNGAFPEVYMHPAEEANYRAFNGPGEIVPVQGGDLLELGGRVLEVIELPGHTPGSIALLDRGRRVLISGDAIQDGGIFMFGPARDLRAYLKSLRACKSAPASSTPSGPPTGPSRCRRRFWWGSASARSASSPAWPPGSPRSASARPSASTTWAAPAS